jgi:hypothetical protein
MEGREGGREGGGKRGRMEGRNWIKKAFFFILK